MKLNTPNKLTIARMLMTPVFLALLLWESLPHRFLIATIVYAIASATDAIDGKLARKNGQITNFGKLLDPIADRCSLPLRCLRFCRWGFATFGL